MTAGLAGAFLGRHLGRKLWSKKYEGKPLLNEPEQKKLGEYKAEFKRRLAEENSDECKKAADLLARHFYRMKQWKPLQRLNQLEKDTIGELEYYAHCLGELRLMASSPFIGASAIVKPEQNNNGVIYVIDSELHKIEVCTKGSTIAHDETKGCITVGVEPEILSNTVIAKDLCAIADDISREKRIVVIAGGQGCVEMKKTAAMITYIQAVKQKLAAEYFASQEKAEAAKQE